MISFCVLVGAAWPQSSFTFHEYVRLKMYGHEVGSSLCVRWGALLMPQSSVAELGVGGVGTVHVSVISGWCAGMKLSDGFRLSPTFSTCERGTEFERRPSAST